MGNAFSTVLVSFPVTGSHERIQSPSGEMVGEFTALPGCDFANASRTGL
jgi:hypothetical protein